MSLPASPPNGAASSPARHTLPDQPRTSDSDANAAQAAARRGRVTGDDVRQFIKFCIVGFGSTVITFAILNLCKYVLGLPLFTSLTAAFLLSVANAFYWNRAWTFKKARGNAAHDQGLKFLAVNIVGYMLNSTIVVLIVAHFTAHGGLFGGRSELDRVLMNILSGEGKHIYPPMLVNGAQAAAVAIVVWWNYFANRFWTFKH